MSVAAVQGRWRRVPGRLTPTRRRVAIVGAVIAVLVSAACSNTGTSTSQTPAALPAAPSTGAFPTGTPKTGGSVTMVSNAVSPRFDPAKQTIYSFTDGNAMNAIFGNLMYVEPGTTEIKMGFLKSFTPSADSKVWTAVLHPNLKFSDDTPFDAEAIAYNIRRAADPTVGSAWLALAQSMIVEVVDATTLTITLPEPNSYFDWVFMERFACIGSPKAMEEAGAEFSARPVGAGPFKFKSANSGQSLTVERNPNYALFAPGQPYLDEVTFQALSDVPQQASALRSGSAQVGWTSGQGSYGILKESGINTTVFGTGGGGNFLLNNSIPPFNDVRARKAFTLALNRTDAANAFAPGTPAATNLFPESSPYYDRKFDFPEQNREEAQKLFDELAAEGKPVNIEYTAPPQVNAQNAANYVQSQLATFNNVTVTIKSVAHAVYLTDQLTSNYQIIPQGLYVVNPIPSISEYYATGGSTNTFKYSNPNVDAALKEIQTTSDQAVQKQAWERVQESLQEDYPIYYASAGVIGFGAAEDITGIELIGFGQVLQWGKVGYLS